MCDYSIIIANWNGAPFIARALSGVEASARQASGVGEVIVIDDASDDDSPEIVARRFPDVRLIRSEVNRGFAASVNAGLNEARGEIAILLNNDIVVRPDFVSTALAPFDENDADDLFAVSAKTLQWTTGRPNHVCMNGQWVRGKIELTWSNPDGRAPALFVQAGACALRREWALRLGGLRDFYRPGYWEDYDLSYRAARCGWRSVHDGGVVAHHLGKASLEARYGEDGVDAMKARNEILFHWANLDDTGLMASFAVGLARRVCGDLARGRLGMLSATLKAFGRLSAVLADRRAASRKSAVGDASLLSK